MAFANEPTDDSLGSSLPFAAPTTHHTVYICVFASADAFMRCSKQLLSTADALRSPNADCLGCCANIDSFQYRKLDNAAVTGFCPM
ncbi:hypothetical protein JMJ77_0007911 [Colletotrichum scovillei]|uniref:Uncharacterized protein n=1 Tax=Colletotrichum scovillei TaxID=1209932 RepID=A0A9P7RFG1_9PEZI|nr:hypothetical protein JMJ77_0007911 [Colletotrichum scovillei]KAG7074896.1 hypothetical protein JMJ76_0011364 [Colletotrichum scovillei]KAG7081992.1 hypothetical protein JMJ78_0004100 [Colletotrichum scovillei]